MKLVSFCFTQSIFKSIVMQSVNLINWQRTRVWCWITLTLSHTQHMNFGINNKLDMRLRIHPPQNKIYAYAYFNSNCHARSADIFKYSKIPWTIIQLPIICYILFTENMQLKSQQNAVILSELLSIKFYMNFFVFCSASVMAVSQDFQDTI